MHLLINAFVCLGSSRELDQRAATGTSTGRTLLPDQGTVLL